MDFKISDTAKFRVKHIGNLNLDSATSGQTHVYYSSGNVTLADDASFTISSAANTGCLISVGSYKNRSNGAAYCHGLFFVQYGIGETGVVELADAGGNFSTSDTDGRICVMNSAGSANITIKNRVGGSNSISVTVHRYQGN